MRHITSLLLLACALACGGTATAADAMPAAPRTAAVTIGGGIEHPLEVDVDSLRKRPAQQIVELQLPSRDGGQPSTVRGVRLRDLIDEAKVVKHDHNTTKKLAVIAGAGDGYKVVFSWSELFNSALGDSVLVLFERDGKPLDSAEGPLALISGKDLNTGPRHVKMLRSIDVRQIVD